MGRTVLRTPLAAALAVALGACTPTTGPTNPATAASGQIASEGTPGPSTADSSNQDRLADLWEAVHAERLAQLHADGEPDAAPFSPYMTGDAIDAVLDYIHAGRPDIAVDLVDVEHWTDIEVAPSGTAADLADCLIVAERPANDPNADPTARSRLWTATAAKADDGGWKLDSLDLGPDNCVSPQLNAQLIDAYKSWHDAKGRWWDPPDPDHPLLDEIMVDPGLSDMQALLAEHQSMGIVVRDGHDLGNAAVVELGIGSARVSDCFPAHPENIAAYDQETGERRKDLSPSPTPDQHDQTIVDLERTADGDWLVNGWRSRTDTDCTPGESGYVAAP